MFASARRAAIAVTVAFAIGGAPAVAAAAQPTAPVLAEYSIGSHDRAPQAIAAGADGALWFTESASKIGRVTTDGMLEEFTVRTETGPGDPQEITAGPDGALWFTESAADRIGLISIGGGVVQFVLPTGGAQPRGIAAGPDGALWFTESAGDKIGRITTGGRITEYPLPKRESGPHGITTGPDGAVWFTERGVSSHGGSKIGRLGPR